MPDDSLKNIQELLIRLDERSASITKEISDLKSDLEKLKDQIKEDNEEARKNLKNYVTKEEFAPIQRSIYGIATLIVTTVVGTLLSLIVHKP
jgi:hypothetical protein